MSIIVRSVTLRNFLSTGNVTQAVRLDDSGLTLVLGHNADAAAENMRNGVGKTTLLQAIFYAFFGEPLADIRLDNLVNSTNAKNMLVTLEFEVHGKPYRIERGRKPNILRFFAGDQELDEAQGANRDTQFEISRLIGISHTLFQHVVGMNTYTTPFLKLKPAQQREVIEELLGITTLSDRDRALAEQMKAARESLRSIEADLKATADANSRIEAAVAQAEAQQEQWQTAHAQQVAGLQTEHARLSGIDIAAALAEFDAQEAHATAAAALQEEIAGSQRDAATLAREMQRIEQAADRVRRATRAEDPQIARLEAEARRQEADARLPLDITRLDAEAARFDTEALRGHEGEASRLVNSADRLDSDAARMDALRTEKEADAACIALSLERGDQICATCQQPLAAGTEHRSKVEAEMRARARALIGEAETAAAKALALRRDANRLRADVVQLAAQAEQAREDARARAVEVRREIEGAKLAHAARVAGHIERAEQARADAAAARLVLAEQRQAAADTLATYEAEAAMVADAMRDVKEAIAVAEQGLAALGRPATPAFTSREAVRALEQDRDRAARDLAAKQREANPHVATVTGLRGSLAVLDTSERDRLSSLLTHQEFLHKLLTGKDSFVRKRIIETNLHFLNTRVNGYLSTLGLPHEVRFLPDMTAEISVMGRDRDFPQLSRGERQRVVLATAWSFRDVWERLNTSMNLLWVDEMIDEGLCEAGVEASLQILTEMARTKSVWLISHQASLVGRVGRVMMVHKENHFTRFEAEGAA